MKAYLTALLVGGSLVATSSAVLAQRLIPLAQVRNRDIHANVVGFSAQPRGACHSQDTQNHPASAA